MFVFTPVSNGMTVNTTHDLKPTQTTEDHRGPRIPGLIERKLQDQDQGSVRSKTFPTTIISGMVSPK